MLPVDIQAKILELHFSQGLSRRLIARVLGVNRKSVARVIGRRSVVTTANPPSPRASILDPYVPRIENLLSVAPGRSAVNILQHLRSSGYTGGITILRDYLRSLRPEPKPKEAFFTLDFAKGEAAQVDWGEFGDAFGNGTKVHVFVMVLCYSRMLYLEFTLRETLPTLLRSYERALRFFETRCREYWHDNMPTVVAERLGKLSRFTNGFLAYAGFHGFKPVLCNLGKGNEKGRVEDGVKLVRNQFWPGRTFSGLDDLNAQAALWRDTFANRRVHETTGKVPELLFDEERQALLPLRPEPYDTDDLLSCTVSRFYRVRFETNTYSVPWTLADRTVTVRADDRTVRIFYGHKRVATHERCYQKNKDIPNPRHEDGLKEIKAGASRTWQVEALKSFGPHTTRYLDIVSATTRSLRSEVKELLCLATVYGRECLEQTIGELMGQAVVGANHLEQALRLRCQTPKTPPPMPLADERLSFVPPTPCLESYDALLLDARKAPAEQEEPLP
jgi:transposase